MYRIPLFAAIVISVCVLIPVAMAPRWLYTVNVLAGTIRSAL